MRIEKNDYDRNFPYTICGSWDDKVYTTFDGLLKLKAEIERVILEEKKKKVLTK